MMIENLSTTERDILLRWFLHYMPVGKSDGAAGLPDADATKATRFEFMRQFPAIYNRLAGAEIVRVVHVSSGTPV